MAAETKVKQDPKEYSLLSNEVVQLCGVLCNWMTSVLRTTGSDFTVHTLGGPESSFSSGVGLGLVWQALTGQKVDFEMRPTSDIAMKANLWGILTKIEEGGVRPYLEGHAWDAESIHRGDLVATLCLSVALAAKAGIRLLRDVCYYEAVTDSRKPRRCPLTPTVHADPRLPPAIFFEVFDGPARGSRYAIRGGDPVMIGRADAASADLTINDETVSSQHCEIVFENGNYMLKDLESTHGTEIAHPWSDELELLGDRDNVLGKVEMLNRGTDIVIGDTTIGVIHIEGTQYYSDYPSLNIPFALTLTTIKGGNKDQVLNCSLRGLSIGSGPAGAVYPHERIENADLAPMESLIWFSDFHGGFFIQSEGHGGGTAIRNLGRDPSWVPLQKGQVEFLQHDDEVALGGGGVVFRVAVIAPPPRR